MDKNKSQLLSSLLRTKIIGTHQIEHYQSLPSTQDRAWELAASGIREGAVVIAGKQTLGRGRYKRAWFSPKDKGLYFSILLRPNIPHNHITFLPLAAGIALHKAIKPIIMNSRMMIRWPNDILICGKKIAGILLEAQFLNGSATTVVLGIGINVKHEKNEFPMQIRESAASLEQFSNSKIDMTDLLAEVLNQFDKIYIMCRNLKFQLLLNEWHLLSGFIGKNVFIKQPDGKEIRGLVQHANTDGSLTLLQDDKEIIITAGDLELAIEPVSIHLI